MLLYLLAYLRIDKCLTNVIDDYIGKNYIEKDGYIDFIINNDNCPASCCEKCGCDNSESCKEKCNSWADLLDC